MFNFLRGSDEVSAMTAASSVNYGSANDKFLFGDWYFVIISDH